MGKFSYDDYMNLKKKGLVSWDDDLIKGHSKNLNDFVKGTSSLTEESFDDNVSKLRELEDQHRYVQTYINSLEGSGSYNGAKRSFDSIDATLNKAKGFYGQFKDSKAYGEALKQQKEAQAAEKQAKAQADEYRYNSKYQDFSYDELTRASKSTAPNLDESERNWLKKAAQNKATAQEYYEKELAPIEARMKELDEQYMQTHYSTPEMQNEYAKLRKQLDEKENIYKQKKDNQAAVNNAVEKREESARLNANLSRKYLTPATGGMSDEQAAKENESYLNRLIEGFYNSNDDKEREWIKERIKSGGFGSKAVEKAMNELYERSDDEAKRISGEYVYDGYETKKKDIIQSSQKKYADAAYMLENVLHPIKRAETSSKYMSLSGNKDFEANSNPDMIAGFTKREDRGELDNKRYMTDDEYKVYTYVYNTQGPEKAEEFFKSIEPELNKKMTEAQAQKEADLANSGLGGAIAASVKSLGYNFISGGGFIEDVVNYAAHKEVDTNSFLNLPANLSNAARQTVQKNIDNPVGQWIYGTTMSIADNAINMLVSKGIGKVAGLAGASASTVNNVAANATSIIMGSQVATQTVIDCKDKGLSDGQALGLGLIHGLVEHITEKVSIENILSDPRNFRQALGKSFVSEGSEEVAANWLDRAADALIMGDKSKERQDFENFKAQGMSDIEAFGQVMLGCLGEDAEAFLAGGVSGIVMSGVSHGFDKVTKGIVKGNEFNKIAEEASKKTDFDERKKELIKEAKESGDIKAVKMAESFERTIERHNGDLSAIKVGDVANIMRVLDDARQNAIESGNEAAAEQQSTVDSIIESSARTMERSKIANKSFNDIGLGAVKGKRVNLNAFGASHPKGIRVTQNSNPSISHDIVRIESSAKEYGEKENTVVLKTSDGRYINADEVTMPTKTYDTLIREAKNYDTNGARGLLANYEGYADYCKRSGKEADVKEYIQQYDALYDLGRHGVRAESLRTGGSARFNSIADAIGIEQAENALNTGANDADAVLMHENNVMLKMRMPGQKHAADSKVVIDVSEGEELNISDGQKNILQAIAQKTGRTIVLTDKLSENVNGTFAPDGKIYINSKIENSNYGVAVALHEAIHGLRTAAPMEYNALKKFIVNYLVEQGENIDDLLDDIAMRWGDSAASEEARLEELVAQSVMALATDDAALKKAIECEENKKLLNKVLDAIKSIAEKVREFIKGTLKDGKITGAHNKQAQFWIENLKALDELAEKFSKAMDEQRVNVREYGQKNNTSGEVRYSKKENGTRNVEQKNSSVIKTANDSIDEYIKTSPQEVEERLNNSDIYRTSKDNNKNNLRIRKFLEEQYPNLTISFKNNKNTGETVVTGIEDKAEAQAKEKAREREYAVKAQRRQAEEIFYKRVKSRTGNNKLFESIEKHLEKEGFEDAIIERSHSVVGTLSFYIEGYDRIIKISDHNTVNQELEHPDTYFIDIKHRTSFAEVWNDVKAILSEAKNGAVENGRKSVDDSFEDRNLVAVHNLSEEKLQKGLKLGGFPMPSIAVTKHDSQHEGFGDISLFFTKDTINPDTNSDNKVYGGDAWTPMYPQVEYEADTKKSNALYTRAREAVKDGNIEFFNPVSLSPDNIEDKLNRSKGEFGLKNELKKDYGFKNLFLKETTGESVKLKQKEEKTTLSQNDIEEYSFLYDQMPQGFLELSDMTGREWLAKYGEAFRGAREAYIKQISPDITEDQIDNAIGHEKGFRIVQRARKILNFHENGPETITVKDDLKGTQAEIDSRVDEKEYSKWLDELLDGIEKNAGIPNGTDPYYSNGDRRSFSATHYTETLENVVRVMKQQRNGESFFPATGIFGVAAKNYGTFDSMKADSSRIQSLSDEEYDNIKNSFGERFSEIAGNIAENGKQLSDNPYINLDICFENILNGVRASKTKSGLVRYLKKLYGNVITDSVANDILDLVADIGNMPTRYFESKPQRAVGFDEVKAAVLPSDTSEEVKTALREKGISVQEYERGSDDSRAQATQAAINTKFTDIEGLKHNDLRFAVDDEITDDLFDTDGDLFEPENKEYLDKFIKTSPDEATLSMYNSLSKTGESVIKEFKGIKLSDENYRKAARRLMKDYDIKLKLNPGTDVELADRIKNFVLWFEKNPNANYNEALNVLADDCKGFLLLSGDYVDSFKEERQDLLSRLKGRTLVLRSYEEDQILENFGGIKGLRRAFFGKANVGYEKNAKGKPKVYIEDLVEEFSEQWGKNWASEDDIDSFAGWAWLDNMLNNVLKPKFVNPYTDGEMSLYRSIDAVAVEMAMQITDELVKEKADAAAKSKSADKKLITELRKKERAAHSAKEALEKSKKEKYKKLADEEKRKRIEMSEHYSDKYKDSERKRIEQNERFRERIREVEGKNKEYRRIIFDSEKSIRERYIEAREKTRYRKLLAKEFERMTKRLDGKAKNNEYIPEKLKKPILDVLNLFEVVPEDGKNLPAYWAEYRNLKDVGKRIDAVAEEYRNLSKGGKTENVFGDQFNADTLAYDEAVEDALSWLGKQIKGKNVYALNAEELKNIYNGMQMLDSQLKKAVEVIIDGKVEYINELAERAVKETQSVYFKKGFDVRNWAIATHLDPVRYGRFLSGYHDDYVTAKLFRDLHDGDKKRVKIIHQAFVDIERTLSKEFTQKELRKLQTADVERFEFVDRNTGKRVKISDAMLLSIYLTDRQVDGHRQLTNDKANHYTVLPDLDLINRDDIPFVGKTYASATKAHSKAVGEKSHQVRFTENDLREIREYIDSNAKLFKLAEAVSSVFNGLIKDEINKVSLQRYGKMIATVKNYFPIVTDKNYPGKKFEVEVGESLRDVRIKSRSFTKQRTHAYNALMIDDVFNVFLKHVQETAEYCGMLIPVENFKRVYGKGNDDVILSKAIENKFGGAAAHYISKLMDDIQKPKDTLDQNILTRLHGNYMGAVLMINPGAAVKQFAAFPTAFKYFGVSNVAKAVPVSLAKGKSIVEKYSEYTPYMWYREKGNGTVVAEVSKQLSLTNRLGDSLDIMGKVDRFVVNSLLYAAEEHVSKTRSDLEFDSEEFKKEVARQFERAVDESQPNNMVTSKPQFVRNQVLRTLSLNAFISQNMAMGNGIIDSGMEYAARIHEAKESKSEEAKKAKHEAGLKFASHVIGTVLSGALLGLLKQLADLIIYHKWDDAKDEEGKTSWLKIAEKWRDDSLEAIVGAFAQGDYIYNTLKTLIFKEGSLNNLEVMSLGTVNDILKNVNKGNLYKAWGLFVDAAGLPLLGGNNIQRMLKGLTLTGIDFFVGDSSPFEHTIFKNNGELDTQFFGDFIVDYMKNGNKEEADKYVKLWQNELVSSGKSENEAMSIIKNKIAAVLTQTDSDVTDAFVAHMNGDTTKYKKLFDKLEGYGFDPSDIDKAIDGVKSDIFAAMKKSGVEKADAKDDLMGQGFSEEAANKLSEEYLKSAKEQKDSAFDDTSEGKKVKFSNKDGLTALKNGDKKTYEQIREYIVEHDSNVENNEAFDKMMRSLTYTGDIVDGYLEAMDNKNEAEREKYKKQLINIYGSWDDAGKVVLKRDKNKRKNK